MTRQTLSHKQAQTWPLQWKNTPSLGSILKDTLQKIWSVTIHCHVVLKMKRKALQKLRNQTCIKSACGS